MGKGIGVILLIAQVGTPALAASGSSPGRSSFPPPTTSLIVVIGPSTSLTPAVGPTTTLTAL
jgi:hypothetical protein